MSGGRRIHYYKNEFYLTETDRDRDRDRERQRETERERDREREREMSSSVLSRTSKTMSRTYNRQRGASGHGGGGGFTTAMLGRGFGELLSLRENKAKKNNGKRDGNFPREPLKRGEVQLKMRDVPTSVPMPSYARTGAAPPWDPRPQLHDAEGIRRMRASGAFAREVLDMAGEMAQPGVSTEEIDAAVHEMVIGRGAYPSPLNYSGFPKSVCTSVNECICHGIPDGRKLRDGDIVNIDVTVFLDGHHGDTSRTFCVGDGVSDEARRLVADTEEALHTGIRVCKPGVNVRDIGAAIQRFTDERKYGLIRDFTGHGVGRCAAFLCLPPSLCECVCMCMYVLPCACHFP